MMQAGTADALELMHEGAIALAQVEAHGLRIDTAYLDRTIKEVATSIHEKEEALKKDRVWKLWKRRFRHSAKLTAPEQLATVIFGEMGYKPTGVTETGKVKSDEASYRNVDLPFVKEYFQVKKLHKVHGTYLKGIQRELVGEYLHPFFHLHTTRTFRGSSDMINFQNIPIRNPEMSRLIRTAFIPPDGYYMGEIDFSGIEVKVACAYTKDPRLIADFTTPGKDPHRDTAAQIFLLPQDDVFKKTTRDAAKNMFVFPEFYGSVYFQCAPPIWEAMDKRDFRVGEKGIPIREHLKSKGIIRLGKCDPKESPKKGSFEYHLKEVEDDFWNKRFKVYTKWKKDWYNAYRKEGGFRTLTGFYIHGLYSRNDVLNYPIQGSAFHCLLWNLIRIQKWLKKNKMRSRIVGQIHDSIILYIHKREVQDVLNYAKECMQYKLRKAWEWINVPMDTEVDIAVSNWHQKKPWDITDSIWQEKN